MTPILNLSPEELIVDSFAGGGGASLGIKLATGRHPDIAINHDRWALRLHAVNHPGTHHYCEDVWEVDPVEACRGRPVGLMWASPDCRHFSRGAAGRPVSKRVRGLAWVVIRWAETVQPRVIILENVAEFRFWGPLTRDRRPCRARKGTTFQKFTRRLERAGYRVEWRLLSASDFGTPTSRRRLILVARRDGLPIEWPAPTHGPGRKYLWQGGLSCVDWDLPIYSMFDRESSLVDNTIARVAHGIHRLAFHTPEPFIVALRGTEESHLRAAARGRGEPLRTISAGGTHYALVAPSTERLERDGQADLFGRAGSPVDSLVRFAPGLVDLPYDLADVGFRMLQPRELFSAQGFPRDYAIDADLDGRRFSKTVQIRLVGNSVCPPLAAAVIRQNLSARAAHPLIQAA